MDEMVLERAKRISLLLMDCDGVLTDGWIILLPDGQEVKAFNSQDGHGLKMAQRAGLRTGVITGRGSVALDQRAKEVGIEFVFQNAKDKNVHNDPGPEYRSLFLLSFLHMCLPKIAWHERDRKLDF